MSEVFSPTLTRTSPAELALATLAAVLPPGAIVDRHRIDSHRAEARLAHGTLSLVWLSDGYSLASAREIVSRPPWPDVVVARRLSPGVRALLSDHGIGWLDETGAAEIASGGVIVSRTGVDEPERLAPGERAWPPAVFSVCEALLTGTRATVDAVHHATGLSVGTCTTALARLTSDGLLRANAARGARSAREVADVGALLSAYADRCYARRPPLSLEFGIEWRHPADALAVAGERLTQAHLRWALTGEFAATLMAPLLTHVAGATIAVEARTALDLRAAGRACGLRPVPGGRLTLRAVPERALYRMSTTVEGLVVAPWPRVYADVRSAGVRGEDAAEHLAEVVGGLRA